LCIELFRRLGLGDLYYQVVEKESVDILHIGVYLEGLIFVI